MGGLRTLIDNPIFLNKTPLLQQHIYLPLHNSLFPSDIQQGLSEGTGLQPQQETSWKERTEGGGPESRARQMKLISNKNKQQ